MKPIVITVMVLAMALAAVADDKKANELIQSAQAKETIHGDLKAAIQLYGQAAREAGANRGLAVKSMLLMAECYQKMGDVEAKKIYERVVSEYADQKDAVAKARARLGGADNAHSVKGDRPVWTGIPPRLHFSDVSSDGRFIATMKGSNLFLHNLVTGDERPLTNIVNLESHEYAGDYSAISKDGKQVAYSRYNGKSRNELRLAGLQGTGVPDGRRLIDSEEIIRVDPYDWSPDGNWIVVNLMRPDRSRQIALVGVRDGSLRVLKSAGWRGPRKISFSPDGKYIAYDLPATETSEQHDIFILSIDGKREIPAVVHPNDDLLMGWSPDGKYLLFASDRTGSMGLWALSLVQGSPQGVPELVKPEIGQSSALGISASGAIYVLKKVSSREINVASIDLDAGKITGLPVTPLPGVAQAALRPDWSLDGKYLANPACLGLVGNCVIQIRSSETGRFRELHPQMTSFYVVRWAPDAKSFIAYGGDFKDRWGIHRIDAQTGETSPIAVGEMGGTFPNPSPDGEKIYFLRRPSEENSILIERDLVSGNEREMIHRQFLGDPDVSPDGRHVATVSYDAPSKTQALLLIPVSGGATRELLRLRPDEFMMEGQWTPDGRGVIVYRSAHEERKLWLVPVDGGEPRKLDIDVTDWNVPNGGGFRLQPDGRKIAFVAGKEEFSIWALDGFLPALRANR